MLGNHLLIRSSLGSHERRKKLSCLLMPVAEIARIL
jgi:hypothetical protein